MVHMPRKNQMIGLMELAWNRCSGDINTIIHYSIGVALGLLFISVPGVMRGHVKTPSFMAGMKCLPHHSRHGDKLKSGDQPPGSPSGAEPLDNTK